MKILKNLIFLLTSDERKQGGFLLAMIIIMAFLDMLGVASILPFMAVVTDPSLVDNNLILNYIFQFSNNFGVQNKDQFLIFLGFSVFILLILSLSFKVFTTYIQLNFIEMREYSIGKRLIEGYLHQPYSWFLSQHSSNLGKNILSEVQQIIANGVRPMIELISKSIVATAIIILLILVDTKLSIFVGLTLFLVYFTIFYFVRSYLNSSGEKRLKFNGIRFKVVNESFNATKEVKIGGLEEAYMENFSNAAEIYAKTRASSQAISLLPRFILEAIAFGGILLIMLYMMTKSGNFNSALPIISLYVFAGYRLMPALQQIYSSFTSLTFISPSLNNLKEDLKKLKINDNVKYDNSVLKFKKNITLKNVYYNYPNTSRAALKNINICISAKSKVGIIGATGSGKTTTIDVILGLLEPYKGTLNVDGKIITKQNVRSWQRLIGYVPQSIYLSDDTIAANIAFGVNSKYINKNRIEEVSRIANFHKFILEELPNQYETKIGERGVRLSGGQRQRIGIARALYHNPRLLIFDEATNALDNETEKAVMEAINNISKEITVILIAHRIHTLQKCDFILKIENGEIVSNHQYKDLLD
jgi:ABC-type multidrug transport system fused ATPase/permease subunit